MSEKNIRANKRGLRRAARDMSNRIVSRYMTENWEKVVMSAVEIIRQFPLRDRLGIAGTILFRPIRGGKRKAATAGDGVAGPKAGV
ncbi:MAG: hypothetical protein LBK61_01400 [Spirochaetaceae bacterium]|nr:hypothetical protein [Spirochaetaceae bacterium]